MITKIKVKENTREAQILMFREIDLSSLPNPRIVPLFGANGAGKTTLMKGIEETIHYQRELLTAEKMKREEPEDEDLYEMIAQTCRNKKSLDISGDETPIVLFRYRNSDDNSRVREARSEREDFDPMYVRNRWNANALSEGQSIMYSLEDLLTGLKAGKNCMLQEGTHAVVLLDEIDSGLSLDNLDSILRNIRTIVRRQDNVQFFLSFNTSYVLKYFPDVMSMYDGHVHHLADEKAMLDEIMSHRKELDKLRKRGKRYIIFD